LKEIEGRYFENCKNFGYPEETAREVFQRNDMHTGRAKENQE